MLIYGKKESHKRVGYVADYCPLCRDLVCCEFELLRMSDHVWEISFGGVTIGHSIRCTVCRTRSPSDPDRYSKIADRPTDDIEQLEHETQPLIDSGRAEELRLADSAHRPGLDPEVKARMLRQAFETVGASRRPMGLPARVNRAAAEQIGNNVSAFGPSEEELRAAARASWARTEWIGEALKDDERLMDVLIQASRSSREGRNYLDILLRRLAMAGPDDSRRRLAHLPVPFAVRRAAEETWDIAQGLPPEGRVVDFCPFCRNLRAHWIFCIAEVLVFGLDPEVRFELQCQTCGGSVPTCYSAYPVVSRRSLTSAGEAPVAPRLDEHLAARLNMEERVRGGDLEEDERWALITEPLVLTGDASGVHPVQERVWLVASVSAAFIAAFATATNDSFRAGYWFAAVLAACLVGGWVFCVIPLRRSTRRAIRHRLCVALRPLRPTSRDLLDAGCVLSKRGLPVAALFSGAREVDEVLAEIASTPPPDDDGQLAWTADGGIS